MGMTITEKIVAAHAARATGVIADVTQGRTWQGAPFPPFLQELIRAGGLAPYVRRRLQSQSR
ncbi:MAG: hypothetical protein ACRELS_08930 [Candidatus Rokuibacteriota bacterium]